MMDTMEATPVTETQAAELTGLLDEFMSTGMSRTLLPVDEVLDLVLDMRRILNPIPEQPVEVALPEPVAS